MEYKPQTITKSYLVEKKYSGVDNQTIKQESFKWRILNVNRNGTLDLISESTTTDMLELYGCIQYNNGVTLLNNICNTLYGNTNIGAKARSINIEDIQDKLDLNIWNYKEAITVEGHKYGEYYTYTGKFPSMLKEDIDFNKESENFELTAFEDINSAISGPETLNLKNTVWKKKLAENNFKKIEGRDNISYYELLYKDRIWFASRAIYVYGEDFTYFGLMRNNSGIDIEYAFYGYINLKQKNAILPVVNIPFDKIETDVSYEENNIWKIKE